jgi:HlyD family secretion protein
MKESEGIVGAGTALIEVGDPTSLEIVADFLTVEAVRLRPGMAAIVDHWGGPQPLAARVRSIEPSGFTKLSALGVEEQRVRVLLDFVGAPTERASLGDAFRVEVHVIAWEKPDALRIPVAALFRRADAWAAFAVDGDHAHVQKLEIGEQSADYGEVKSGATEGMNVVLRPSETLKDGTRVEATAK